MASSQHETCLSRTPQLLPHPDGCAWLQASRQRVKHQRGGTEMQQQLDRRLLSRACTSTAIKLPSPADLLVLLMLPAAYGGALVQRAGVAPQ
jgi:hypothetical protein